MNLQDTENKRSSRFRGISSVQILTKLALLATGLVLTNHFVLSRLAYFLEFGFYFPLAVFCGIWIAALVALIYVAFTPRKSERIVWVILIGLATWAAESHYLITGTRITIQAIDAMWDPGLMRLETVGFFGTYFLQALLFTTPLLLGLLLPAPAVRVFQYRVNMLLPLAPCVLLGGLVFYVGSSVGHETRGMPSQFLNLGLFPIFALSETQPQEKSAVSIPVVGEARVKNIVLIVDESIAGDFIDLNRQRGITPYLLAQSASVANFGLAISATNCSYSSNAILRLGADPETLGKSDQNILANPSVWKYAEKAGFETTFIEAQKITARNQYFMNRKELALIDHIFTVSGEHNYHLDAEAAEQLAEVLKRPGPQFVYVNKFGAHFPYHRAYPESEEIFKPAMQPYESIANRQHLVNAYKNAVKWSVDEFFKILLPAIDLSDTVIFYTSDHGQNLLDDGKPVTHCRRSQETIAEALVPLLVLTQNEQLRPEFDRAAATNWNRASHYEIFPAVLGLFGYDPVLVEELYYQGLLAPIEEPKGFISGPVTGRLGQRPKWQSRENLDRFERQDN